MKRMAMTCVAAVALSLGCAGAPAVDTTAPPARNVKLPLSALPKPGQCAVWSPEKSEASASALCSEFWNKVKAGDWLLVRGHENVADVQVTVYGDFGEVKDGFMLDGATGKSK